MNDITFVDSDETSFTSDLGQKVTYTIIPLTEDVRRKAFFSKIGRIFRIVTVQGVM